MAFVMGTNSTERRVRVVEEPPQMNVEPRAHFTSERADKARSRRYE